MCIEDNDRFTKDLEVDYGTFVNHELEVHLENKSQCTIEFLPFLEQLPRFTFKQQGDVAEKRKSKRSRRKRR